MAWLAPKTNRVPLDQQYTVWPQSKEIAMSASSSSEDGTVICPYCEKAIGKFVLQKRDTDPQLVHLSVIYPPYLIVVTCPHCKMVLSTLRPS
jgi:glutaredoxin